MTRTTPPPHVDVAVEIPGIGAYAGTTVRLHPRPGRPEAGDSHVAGPLLWPADEPWPVCDVTYADHLAEARRLGLATGWAASAEPGTPVALVALAQLRVADFPEIPFPEGADLVQIMWCPNLHLMVSYAVHVVWRREAEIGEALRAAVTPSLSEDHYLPRPCVIDPERVIEYPWWDELPPDLQQQVDDWGPDEYQYLLSTAPGWKVGGSMDYSLTDGTPPLCEACGSAMFLLLQVDGFEWGSDGAARWQPMEEHHLHRTDPGYSPSDAQWPTGVYVRGGYHMGVYTCRANPRHPVQAW